MKKIILSILLSLLFYSCSTSDPYLTQFREVGYISTTIANIDDYSIQFSNGMAAKTRRLVIGVNSTPVLLIVENYLGSGYFYLGKSKIYFSPAGGSDIDMMGMHRGRLHYIKTISLDENIIELVDGTRWLVPNEDHAELLDGWTIDTEIVIPENKPPQGEYFINTATTEAVFALPVQVDSTNLQG